jgi:hypothetical protein
MPNIATETRRKGYWCAAASGEEVFAGSHTWKLRIDHISDDCDMLFGVFAGEPPSPHAPLSSHVNFHSYFEHHATLAVGPPTDWEASCKKNGEFQRRAEAITTPPHAQRIRAGDVMSLSINLFDGKSDGDIEWRLNESSVCILRGSLARASFRLFLDLHKHSYQAESVGVTLLDYTKE